MLEDTIAWAHQTYDNGFLSLTEIRDTTWSGAELTSKRVYFGDLSALDSLHAYTVSGQVETLTFKTFYKYPTTNETVTRNYSLQNGAFTEIDRAYRTFDAAGQLIEYDVMQTNWQNQQLEYSYRFIYNYTPFGEIDSTWIYNYVNGSFNLDSYIYKTFNANNKIVDETYWGKFNNNFFIEQRYERFYDALGRLDHIHNYFYAPNQTFELERYYGYNSDLNGNIDYEIEYEVTGPDTANDWFIGHEMFWEYDGTLLTRTKFFMYFSASGTTLYDYRYVHSSEVFPIGLEEEMSSSEFTVFPNPSSDHLEVRSDEEFNRISIYDIQGNHVMTITQLRGKQCTLPLNSLSSGTYMLQMIDGETLRGTTRFVKL